MFARMKSMVAAWLLVPTMLAMHAPVTAQGNYPDRPIRMVVPYPPGGGIDPLARMIGQRLTEDFGQPVIIDNKPGGNTLIGAQFVATAPPDGYTLLMTTDQTHTINPWLYKTLPYDPVKSFIPITNLLDTGQFLVVHSSVPAKTIQEFIQYAKANPNKLSYGSAGGSGSPTHLNMEKFMRHAGIQMVHVPYKGGAAAVQDLVGGSVQALMIGLGPVGQFISSGTVRALAVGTSARSPLHPNVPTFKESIGHDYLVNRVGVFAPAGTPAAIVHKLQRQMAGTLKTQAANDFYVKQGWEISGNTPEDYAVMLTKDRAVWGAAIRDAGVKPE